MLKHKSQSAKRKPTPNMVHSAAYRRLVLVSAELEDAQKRLSKIAELCSQYNPHRMTESAFYGISKLAKGTHASTKTKSQRNP